MEGMRQLEPPTFTDEPGEEVVDTLAQPPGGDTKTIREGGATQHPFVPLVKKKYEEKSS